MSNPAYIPHGVALQPPRVTVIITHYNFTSHLQGALESVLAQTYDHWECLVIDDHSEPEQYVAAEHAVDVLGSPKIRIAQTSENMGQADAFFAAFAQTSGEFVALLDPDDRWLPHYLERMIAAHLNSTVAAPLACCDQMLFRDGHVLMSTNGPVDSRALFAARPAGTGERGGTGGPAASEGRSLVSTHPPALHYLPKRYAGWPWTSTSAMVFRRAAIDFLVPNRRLGYQGEINTYLAQAAHVMGGSLIWTEALVQREIHQNNMFMGQVFSNFQDQRRAEYGAHRTLSCFQDAMEMLRANGGIHHVPKTFLEPTVSRQRRFKR